jgi:membrane-bound lytic murein transglycosylase MltF
MERRAMGGTAALQRFEQTLALFEQYGTQYAFDPLRLAAQGYQESQLNQDAKSHVGAIGIMQVMPATGREMKVGEIKVTASNIHAGTKYLDRLMTKFFPNAQFSENNRSLFVFASYNAGPGNIARMRLVHTWRGACRNSDDWAEISADGPVRNGGFKPASGLVHSPPQETPMAMGISEGASTGQLIRPRRHRHAPPPPR